jgi:RND superfamily putative drug exporter
MPLVIGAVGVVMVLVSLLLATRITDLSIFALNLATMLGFGLAVDYSLLVTARFREELAHGQPVAEAVSRTMATAGKSVFFSGTTVLIGLLGLSQFEFLFLRSVGVAGVIVVAWSTVAALTLLPAMLAIVGPNIDRLSLRRTPRETAPHQRLLGRPLAGGDAPPGGRAHPDAGAARAAGVAHSATPKSPRPMPPSCRRGFPRARRSIPGRRLRPGRVDPLRDRRRGARPPFQR